AAGESRDVRVITASDIDLQDAVARRRFRPDLYYVLASSRIDVPPLRDRGDDVRLLAEQLLGELSGNRSDAVRSIDERALDTLVRYDWPGNIRQLRAVLARALAFADGPVLRISHLPPEIVKPVT